MAERGGQERLKEVLQTDVGSMRRDWGRVKEEMHRARCNANRQSNSVGRAERKMGEMQKELDRANSVIKDLLDHDA